jgi:hypothetical protein
MKNAPMQDAEIWAAWKAQAHSAIAQGQTQTQFVAHAARLNRNLARRAYLTAQVELQPLYPPVTICAWCHPGENQPGVTHGICEKHKAEMLVNLT